MSRARRGGPAPHDAADLPAPDVAALAAAAAAAAPSDAAPDVAVGDRRPDADPALVPRAPRARRIPITSTRRCCSSCRPTCPPPAGAGSRGARAPPRRAPHAVRSLRRGLGADVPGARRAAAVLGASSWRRAPEDASRAAVEAAAAEAQRSLDLVARAAVARRALRARRARGRLLLVVIHHLVVDGVSWRVLLEDLQTALASSWPVGEHVRLPSKTTSFRRWAERPGRVRIGGRRRARARSLARRGRRRSRARCPSTTRPAATATRSDDGASGLGDARPGGDTRAAAGGPGRLPDPDRRPAADRRCSQAFRAWTGRRQPARRPRGARPRGARRGRRPVANRGLVHHDLSRCAWSGPAAGRARP